MKIWARFIGCGILKDESGRLYVCDYDGESNVLCLDTGEIFRIVRRDDEDNTFFLET